MIQYGGEIGAQATAQAKNEQHLHIAQSALAAILKILVQPRYLS